VKVLSTYNSVNKSGSFTLVIF